MQKLFGVTGPQGCGKTTTLTRLAQLYNYKVDDYKVSRETQAALGFATLEEAYANPQSMMKFQENVLLNKYARDSMLKERNELFSIILTERSFIDIAVYTKIWINELSKKDFPALEIREMMEWYYEMYLPITKAYQKVYDGIIYILPHKAIKFEVDPNRAKEEHVDDFDALAKSLTLKSGVQTLFVDALAVDDRASQISRYVEIIKTIEQD